MASNQNEAQSSCAMAAQAALEVVQEECGGEDVAIMEAQPGMFLEVSKETEQIMQREGAMSASELERTIKEDNAMRGWIRSMCRLANAGGDMAETRGCIYGMAEAFLSAEFSFPADEVTDETVEAVAV